MLSVATNLSVVSVEVCQLLAQAWLAWPRAGGTQTANAMRSDRSDDPIQANLLAVCPASQSPPRLRSTSTSTMLA